MRVSFGVVGGYVVFLESMLEVAQRFDAGVLKLANPAVVDFLQRHWVEEMQLLPPAPLHGDDRQSLRAPQSRVALGRCLTLPAPQSVP
jgi:hypothetical protein